MTAPIVILDDPAETSLAVNYSNVPELVTQYLNLLHFCEENGVATPSIEGTAFLLEEMCAYGNPAGHDLSDQNRLAALINGIEALTEVHSRLVTTA